MAFTVQKRELTLENPFLYWKGFVELDILFSDGHSLLHVDLNCNSKHNPTKPDLLQNNIPRWVENKKQTLISNIKSDEVLHNKSELQMLTSDTAAVCSGDINNLTNRISNIFISSAQISFTRKENFIETTEDKKWFGPDCLKARNDYHLAKKNSTCQFFRVEPN